jgi:hypothetical protein
MSDTRLDPLRATECSVHGGASEVIMVFKRNIIVEDEKGARFEASPSAAVAMTWENAAHLRGMLDELFRQRNEQPKIRNEQPKVTPGAPDQ